MIKRLSTITAVLATAALTAAGGVALAQGATQGHHKLHTAAHHSSRAHLAQASDPTVGSPGSGVDGDNVQSGDQTQPDPQGAGGQEQQSSELQSGDGPGGHADEPGSPNAENQEEGEH
jgi:hypothetical protein